MLRGIFVFGICALLCTPAKAAVVIGGQHSFHGLSILGSNSSTVAGFNKFDPTLGTLNEIIWEYSSSISNLSGNVDSRQAYEGPVDVRIGLFNSIQDVPFVPDEDLFFETSDVLANAGSVRLPPAATPFEGPTAFAFKYSGPLSDSGQQSIAPTSSYVGTGGLKKRITLGLSAKGYVAGTDEFLAQFGNESTYRFTGSQSVTLLYDYTPAASVVPEPSMALVWSCLALACSIGWGVRSRLRKSIS